jgi:hypothetical protein
MQIYLKDLEENQVMGLLSHFQKQKLRVLTVNPCEAAEDELVQINHLIKHVKISKPSVVNIYEDTWKRYTPDSLKVGVTAYTNKDWEELNQKSYEVILDHAGVEIFEGDKVFITFEDCGAIIADVVRFTEKGIILNTPNKEKFLHQDHTHRILKINQNGK